MQRRAFHIEHRTLAAALALTLTLTACGGDEPAPRAERAGVFIDSAVAGLNYFTESRQGLTTAAGAFTYRETEAVSFFVGPLLLGTAAGQAVVTPLTLVPAAHGDLTNDRVTNIAVLLQSLDVDLDATNGITVPAAAAGALQAHPVNLDLPADDFAASAALYAAIRDANNDQRNPVTPEQAREHLRVATGGDPAATLDSLTLSPPAIALQIGASQLFTASGHYSDGSTRPLSDVTWASSNPGVARVSTAGEVTALAAGTSTLSARRDGKTGTAQLTVTLPPPTFKVGVGSADHTPTSRVCIGGGSTQCGRAAGPDAVRDPLIARAVAITGENDQTFIVVTTTNIGYFLAYKPEQGGLNGIYDVRLRIARATGVPSTHITVVSDHSHSGPDTIGIWGGVSADYLKLTADAVVTAAVQAYGSRREAHIRVASINDNEHRLADARALKSSYSFAPGYDLTRGNPYNEFRMLVADAVSDGTRILTFVNYAPHATVTNGDRIEGQYRLTGDWPAWVNREAHDVFGAGMGIGVVGALGGTDWNKVGDVPQKEAEARERLRTLMRAANDALEPVAGGDVKVDAVFIHEPLMQPVLLLNYKPGVDRNDPAVPSDGADVRIDRSVAPPFLIGSVVGTYVSAARIGDVFLSTFPGEPFGELNHALRDEGRVQGARAQFLLGAANDFFGYMVKNSDTYEQTARTGTLYLAGCPEKDFATQLGLREPGEDACADHWTLMVSPTIGSHIVCTLQDAADRLGFNTAHRDAECPVFTALDGLAAPPESDNPILGPVLDARQAAVDQARTLAAQCPSTPAPAAVCQALAEGARAAETYFGVDPAPAAATASGVWLKTDLHIHDDHSADGSFTRQTAGQGGPGNMPLKDQIGYAETQGLDFMALNDHRTFDQHYDPQWTSSRLLLLTGEEANGSPHATVFGALDMINQADNPAGTPEFRKLQQSIWDAQLQGAVWSTAHPDDGEVESVSGTGDGTAIVPNAFAFATGPHLAEIWNRGTLNAPKIAYCEDRWNAGYRFGIAGASDNHFKELWPIAGPGQPITRVFARDNTTASVLDALRAGHTSISLNDRAPFVTLSGDFSGDGRFGTLGGDEVRLPTGATAALRVTISNGVGTEVRIYRMPGKSAGPFLTFMPVLPVQTFDFNITADRPQDWYRVEVRGPGEIDALDYKKVTDCDPRSLFDGEAPACDPTTAVDSDYANAMRATTSPIFISTTTLAQPESPALPLDTAADDAAVARFGSAQDNAFAGFSSLSASGDTLHAVAEVRDGGASRVLYRRQQNGEWTAAVNLAPESRSARLPRIAAAGAQVWAVWQDERAGEIPHRPQIYLRHSSDGGQTWAAAQAVSTTTARAEHPDVALIPTATSVAPVVVWQDNSGGAFDIYAKVIGRDAAPLNLSAPGKQSTPGVPSDARSAIYPASVNPSVAVRADGLIAVAWQDNRNDPDPGWTGRMIHADEIPDSLAQQEFISHGTQTDDWEILLATRAVTATLWSAVRNVSQSPALADRHPALAFDAEGALHAAWDSKTINSMAGPRLSIHANRSGDGGITWSPALDISRVPDFSSQRPVFGYLDGTPRLFWTDGRSADWRWRIRSADWDSQNGWTDAGFVTGPGNAAWPSYANGWLAFTSDRSATREQRKPQQVFVRTLDEASAATVNLNGPGAGPAPPAFDLCVPLAGSNYCLSDLPVLGPLLLGVLQPILGGGTPVTPAADSLASTAAKNCRDNKLPDSLCTPMENQSSSTGLSRYVDPRIGSTPPGFTNPGPFAPYGMTQPGPDTEGPLNFGGYYIHNALITGFSQVHMSAGVYKGGYFPLLPFTGDLPLTDDLYQGQDHPVPGYSSSFDHATEVAQTGYYATQLSRYGVKAELTATPRAALHRYTFNDPTQAPRVLIDVARSLGGYWNGSVRVTDGVVSGRVQADFPIYFAARVNAPFVVQTFAGDAVGATPVALSKGNSGVILDFTNAPQTILVKVGVSYTDEAGALTNLDGEIPGWDFDGTRAATVASWNEALSRIEVEGGTLADRISLYTALYRAQQFPSVHSDLDGRYRSPTGIHSDTRPHYSQFSSWDSYRGQNQLQAEIVPERYADMIHSLLAFHREAGYLPRWQEGSIDASHMSGDPIIPFIGEAWCRGDIDAATRQQLWPAMQNLVTRRDPELAQKGYLSDPPPDNPLSVTELQPIIDLGPSHAGTTLEYGIADFSLALMAQDAAAAEAPAIAQRALNYKNLLDTSETQWIRPRMADGSWLTPFQPEFGYGFQEGNSWQYSWLSMHDYAGLIAGMGGEQAVNDRLDIFFNFPSTPVPVVWPTIQNQITMFGIEYLGNQYAPGNEHDLEAPYVYHYIGAPWKSAATARAAASIYTPTPNGMPGNDDLGALSGWLVWNLIGLYPENPGTPLMLAGSPHFDRVVMRRPRGDLVIESTGASDLNRFVTGLELDAQPLSRSWLILPRGPTTLRMQVSAVPDTSWASASADRPPSFSVAGLSAFGCRP